ncbi:MAG: hypothetical protein NZ533_05150 [Casimicrobiaceae bacterium]|nr:hypothetical protein [Casimicrobiaceae bacterium]MCX8099484.1 hypothetical protein [Casimicrobiaceae bacterium]MDW8312487.1 hypothetical protein [Burkholderiales bacterium]
MGKFIFWIVVIFVLLFALRLASLAAQRKQRRGPPPPESSQTHQQRAPFPPGIPTVRCSVCGSFIPKSASVLRLTGYRCADPDCAGRKR